MAAITQPSAFGSHSGRRYGSFANKTGSTAVAGPYCVAAGEFFAPHVKRGEVMRSNVTAGQAFKAGIKAAQTCCEG